MLSLTAPTSPASGSVSPPSTRRSTSAAAASASASGRSVIQISGRCAARIAVYAAETRSVELVISPFRRLFDHDGERTVSDDLLAGPHQEAIDDSRARRGDRDLELHRLEGEQHLSRCDCRTDA